MYRIIRFYADSSHMDHKKVIEEGLTKEEAQEYCRGEDSRESGVWFDGYEHE